MKKRIRSHTFAKIVLIFILCSCSTYHIKNEKKAERKIANISCSGESRPARLKAVPNRHECDSQVELYYTFINEGHNPLRDSRGDETFMGHACMDKHGSEYAVRSNPDFSYNKTYSVCLEEIPGSIHSRRAPQVIIKSFL